MLKLKLIGNVFNSEVIIWFRKNNNEISVSLLIQSFNIYNFTRTRYWALLQIIHTLIYAATVKVYTYTKLYENKYMHSKYYVSSILKRNI